MRSIVYVSLFLARWFVAIGVFRSSLLLVFGPELFLLFFLTGLSTFTDKKRMPPHLTMKPERLWQLDPESRFPDELEIFVPQDRGILPLSRANFESRREIHP